MKEPVKLFIFLSIIVLISCQSSPERENVILDKDSEQNMESEDNFPMIDSSCTLSWIENETINCVELEMANNYCPEAKRNYEKSSIFLKWKRNGKDVEFNDSVNGELEQICFKDNWLNTIQLDNDNELELRLFFSFIRDDDYVCKYVLFDNDSIYMWKLEWSTDGDYVYFTGEDFRKETKFNKEVLDSEFELVKKEVVNL